LQRQIRARRSASAADIEAFIENQLTVSKKPKFKIM